MRLLAKTFSGLEDILEKELINLGAVNTEVIKRAVYFDGDKELLYKANYETRTAISILIPVGEFQFEDEDDLYDKAKEINWNEFLNEDMSFGLTTICESEMFSHSKYPSIAIREAISDYFTSLNGNKPKALRQDADLLIDVLIMENSCFISLNSSGGALFKRGYRTGEHPAPINEVLAAGLIQKSNWDTNKPLLDPMCGTGTILIEAAMIAYNIPAGICREEYGFERWQDFDNKLWERIKQPRDLADIETEIWGNDVLRKNIETTRASLQKLGLGSKIKLMGRDFLHSSPPTLPGVIISHPPYKERVKSGKINALYKSLGKHLKEAFKEWDVWFISPATDHFDCLNIEVLEQSEFINGEFDSEFRHYKIPGTADPLPEPVEKKRKLRPRKPRT